MENSIKVFKANKSVLLKSYVLPTKKINKKKKGSWNLTYGIAKMKQIKHQRLLSNWEPCSVSCSAQSEPFISTINSLDVLVNSYL